MSEPPPDTCVFCQIGAGALAADEVRRDADFVAFHDVQPRAATHVLIIPVAHHEHLDSWIAAGAPSDAMLQFVHAVAAELDLLGRYRLVTNVGEEGGQVVPHLHWHLMAGSRLPGF